MFANELFIAAQPTVGLLIG